MLWESYWIFISRQEPLVKPFSTLFQWERVFDNNCCCFSIFCFVMWAADDEYFPSLAFTPQQGPSCILCSPGKVHSVGMWVSLIAVSFLGTSTWFCLDRSAFTIHHAVVVVCIPIRSTNWHQHLVANTAFGSFSRCTRYWKKISSDQFFEERNEAFSILGDR